MPAACPSFRVPIVTLLCLLSALHVSSTNQTKRAMDRTKRQFETKYLIFPQGSNVQLVYCLTISTYAKPSGMFTVGITAGQAWELPSESMLSRYPSDVYHRRSRRELYRKMELLLETLGKDGRACILHAICRAARLNQMRMDKGTFFEEIMRVIFSLPGDFEDADTMTEYERAYFRQENCDVMEDRCPDGF